MHLINLSLSRMSIWTQIKGWFLSKTTPVYMRFPGSHALNTFAHNQAYLFMCKHFGMWMQRSLWPDRMLCTKCHLTVFAAWILGRLYASHPFTLSPIESSSPGRLWMCCNCGYGRVLTIAYTHTHCTSHFAVAQTYNFRLDALYSVDDDDNAANLICKGATQPKLAVSLCRPLVQQILCTIHQQAERGLF